MSKLLQTFDNAKKEKRPVIIPYFVAGFPSLELSETVFLKLIQERADIIEVGIPFSDPLADGETIQKAGQEALNNGINTEKVFELIRRLRKSSQTPILVMTYYNLFYHYGLEKFAKNAKEAGADGVIIPDLPPEEATEWLNASKGLLETVFLLAPTSSDERIKKVDELSTAFIYCVSLTGVTGTREKLPDYLPDFLRRVRKISDRPLAVGFGISTLSQAQDLSMLAEGIIIGSAFIKTIDESPSFDKGLENLGEFINQFKKIII